MAKEMTLTVVGLNYRLTVASIKKLAEDAPLHCRLEREASNLYDANAVKVLVTEKPWAKKHGPFHIGYLKREVAAEIAPRMDAMEFPDYDVWLMEVDADHATGDLKLTPRKK